MTEVLTSWMGREGYLPHGYCFTWSPGLLWTMVGSDAVIAASYYSIPLALLQFARRRPDVQFKWLLLLFSAFIFACGTTHVLDIWTVWQPDYAVHALAKVVTAAASLVTAVVLWPLIPKALEIPSAGQLQRVINALEAEVRLRRSAEDHLSDVQQSLAVTLGSIGAGFIATDRAGHVTRMNDVAERITGWSQADAAGRPFWEVLARDDRPARFLGSNPVDVMLQEQMTLDTVHHVTCVARDGSRTPIEAKAALTHAADGSVRGMAMVFRDTTRLQQAEAESQRLAAIVESSFDAIIGKTLDGRITSWNAAAQDLFGYSAAQAIGQPIQMLVPEDRADEELRIQARLQAGERSLPIDTLRRTQDGRLLEVSITLSPIRDAQGGIVGMSKIARDVSAQRRAEAALRESEERLRLILQAAQIGDWELDIASGATRRSPRHDQCFGYDTPRPDWSAAIFFDHVHPDDRAQVRAGFDRCIAQGGDWSFDCRVVWPDGSLHWIAGVGRIWHDGGAPKRLMGIVTDTTGQRLAEQARLKTITLEAENLQIVEANRLKSEFLANMSHELRTPLNAIIGFADLLHAGKVPADSPKHKVFVNHIRTSGRHLLQLINDILDLSKVESGKFEFAADRIDPAVLAGEVMNVLEGQAAAKAIAVTVQIDPALGSVVTDGQRLKQVLYNYLSNALKFTPEGGTVTVRAVVEDARWWRLEVQDSGIGIQPDDIPRLFNQFTQLDAGLTKVQPGTGLGLALTRRLVEAQGGTVGVQSQPGGGSVFHARLLRQPAPVHDAALEHVPPGTRQQQQLQLHHQDQALKATPGGRAVLVVEDNPADAALLADALQGAGFSVEVATTAAQALALARNRSFSAITLDLQLPDRTGLELLADVRATAGNREVPVLVISVLSGPFPVAAFSVTDVLSKPVDGPAVVAALRRNGVVSREHSVVMVVDDDRPSRELMTSVLASGGYSAATYAGAEPALEALESLRPAAVILDLAMPGFDGFQFLDRLRAMPVYRLLPVFVWTSRDLSSADHQRLQGKAQAVMLKSGVDVGVLLAHIRSHIEAAGR